MALEVIQTDLPEVLLIKPRVFEDSRGFFYESFNRRDWLDATGIDCDFVQDNHSRSLKGVLRGLHYQLPPVAQGKLVRVLVGEVFDVAVDIRRDSQSFGQWVGHKLSAESKTQMWMPAGFAHGFLVLSDIAEVHYKTTDYYNHERERSICWNDASLAINWPVTGELSLSAKDKIAPLLSDAELF
ncbi:MAG: dTDP-4-dehydrorhamnose 3,5-epimerase [Deltaproteobacteria bacterium]|nr:MAG: dTDP-4-dehydrorhamnose 3,5-epimerase [Deltaproteobacteria bacterium]